MPDDDVKLTEYGPSVPGDQPGGETYDPNSYHGIGDRSNTLITGYSAALTPSERLARFGVTGKSTGLEFEYQGKTYRDDDTAAQMFHGRDEGNRIDVYQGGNVGPGAMSAGDPSRMVGLGGPSLSAGSIYDPAMEPWINQPDSLTTLSEDQPPEEAKSVNTDSPYEAWAKKNPLLAEVAEPSEVLEKMHNKLAPDMDQALFNRLATAKNGWQAIQDIKNNVTPLDKFRRLHPEFADISDNKIADDVYDGLVKKGKINPAEMSHDEFAINYFNPKPGLNHALYNAFLGAGHSTMASFPATLSQAAGGLDNFSKMFEDLMNTVGNFATKAGPGAKDPLTGKDVQITEPNAGTKLKTLANQADDYLKQQLSVSGPGYVQFSDFWKNMNGWLLDVKKSEEQASQAELKAAYKAQGGAGYVGRFAGEVTGGAITSLPIFGALGSESKLAALAASMYLGTSQYGSAVDSGHKNALLEGVTAGLTGPAFKYMMDSPAGRLRTAFMNFVLNSGEDEIRRMQNGEETNWWDFAAHATVDTLIGASMGKGMPPDAMEELAKAKAAREKGDLDLAGAHLDTMASMLPPKDQQDLGQRFIDAVGNNGDQKHNEFYFGVEPKPAAFLSTEHLASVEAEAHPEYRDPQRDYFRDEWEPVREEQQQGAQAQAGVGGPEAQAGEHGSLEARQREDAISIAKNAQGYFDRRNARPGGAVPPAQGVQAGPAVVPGGRAVGGRPNLIEWAKGIGRLFDPRLWPNWSDPRQLFIGGGMEHGVFHHPWRDGWVIKFFNVHPENAEKIRRYFERIELYNKAFPEVRMNPAGVIANQVFDKGNKGFYPTYDERAVDSNGNPKVDENGNPVIKPGKAMIVAEAPFFKDVEPNLDLDDPHQWDKRQSEIIKWFENRHWKRYGNYSFYHPGLGIQVGDAHAKNLIKIGEDNFIPIDVGLRDVRHGREQLTWMASFHPEDFGLPGSHVPGVEEPPPAAQAPAPPAQAPHAPPQGPDSHFQRLVQRDLEAGNIGVLTAADRLGGQRWSEKLANLNLSELRAQEARYRQQGQHAKADVIRHEIIRRQGGGQRGAIVFPAERIRKFFDQLAEPLIWANRARRLEYNPEALGEGAVRAANIVRKENVRAAQAEYLRTWMNDHRGVDLDLRGAMKHMRRREVFNQLSNTELKNLLIAFDDKKQFKAANPELQKAIDDLLQLHKWAHAGMAHIEHKLGLSYDLRDTYMYHAIKPEQRAQFEQWLNNWAAKHPGWNVDPRFTKMRELPTWREVFAAGFEARSLNPEDLFQMRLFAHTEVIKKITDLRQIADLGLAFLTNPKQEDIAKRMAETGMTKEEAEQSFKITPEIRDSSDWVKGEFRAPNGELYVVQRDAAALLRNAFDHESLYESNRVLAGVLPVRYAMHAMRTLKGASLNILSWSQFHLKHITFTSLTNLLSDWTQSALKGRPFNRATAWEEAVNAVGRMWRFKDSGIPLLDYYHDKRSIRSLSPDDLALKEAVEYMGLNFGLSHERQMSWEFGRNLAEWFPKLRHPANVFDKFGSIGMNILTARWMQKWQFGQVIPRLKMADAMRDYKRLLQDHPEYLLPGNAEEYHTALAQIGKAIEGKYGEMNHDNLFWKHTTKELWVASLLSLGWQLSAIRVYAGGIKDLMDNTVHIRDVIRKVDDPKKRAFFTDRLSHMMFYTSAYMVTNAIISYINGYSKGKPYEEKDLWFPVIGENPPGSEQRWMRGSPGEFAREIASIMMHIKSEGGGVLGTIYGTGQYAANKLQPALSTMKQILWDQKNYFGADIGGSPSDNQLNRIADKIAYYIENTITPIPFKQQLANKPGQPGVTMEKFAQDPLGTVTKDIPGRIFQWSTLWSMMGYPEAAGYVGRTDLENLIHAEFENQFGGGAKSAVNAEKMAAYEQYREALKSQDEKQIDAAAQQIEDLGKKYHFNAYKAMQGVRKNAQKDITSSQYMFSRLDWQTQQNILNHASEQEKQELAPFTKQ